MMMIIMIYHEIFAITKCGRGGGFVEINEVSYE